MERNKTHKFKGEVDYSKDSKANFTEVCSMSKGHTKKKVRFPHVEVVNTMDIARYMVRILWKLCLPQHMCLLIFNLVKKLKREREGGGRGRGREGGRERGRERENESDF